MTVPIQVAFGDAVSSRGVPGQSPGGVPGSGAPGSSGDSEAYGIEKRPKNCCFLLSFPGFCIIVS